MDELAATDDVASFISLRIGEDPHSDVGAAATPMPECRVPAEPSSSASREMLRSYRSELSEQMEELTGWWLRRMIAVNNPTREKLTLLWHNHFATSASKVKKAAYMAAQNEKIRRLCVGNFDALAFAMLTDAAMLVWLDGEDNKRGAPNENLAREFMELFAIGYGSGYTESDVREGARALTGWVPHADGSTSVSRRRHDFGTKSVLGATGTLEAEEFARVVLDFHASARYVTSRLWHYLASDSPPSDDTANTLLNAYGPTRDLQSLTLTILTTSEFLNGRATKISSPVEWLVGLLRTLRVPLESTNDAHRYTRALRALGQVPFYPPDVSGWPSGPVWLSASTSLRMKLAEQAAKVGDISVVEEAGVADRLEAVGYLIGVGSWTRSTANALNLLRSNPSRLVAAAVNTPEYLTA